MSVKEVSQDESDRLARIFKINIFIKIFIIKEINHDAMNRLTQISEIYIYIKKFINERLQPWRY